MKILAIETSCDETAISIIEVHEFAPGAKVRVLSNVVLSQVKKHAAYGGVFPSLAVREHSQNLVPVLREALEAAGLINPKSKILTPEQIPNRPWTEKLQKIKKVLERERVLLEKFLAVAPTIENPGIDALAVTYGPGLEPALWVGVNFAKALAIAWSADRRIPLIPVNHMEGHVFSAVLTAEKTNSKSETLNSKQAQNSHYKIQNVRFPALALLISGGHTELVLMRDWFDYEIVGETKDDAAGEAFDKVARMLGLPYPGGPAIAAEAAMARGIDAKKMSLPRPMLNSGDFNFSFSGLKTAVLYKLKEFPKITDGTRREMSYEFQEAVTEVLVAKTVAAAERYDARTVLVGGGVSANNRIREALGEAADCKLQAKIFFAPSELTGDNALMIAVAAAARAARGMGVPPPEAIAAKGTARLDSIPKV